MKKKTAPSPAPAESNQPPAKITPIRTETLLCQYPFHQLSKSGAPINFKFTAANEQGETVTIWHVSANEEYGAPGLLAYKIDTLIINRAIDDLGPDVPQTIKLGSLHEIAKELGLGRDTDKVKKALHQNASAYVVADLKYKGKDGTKRKFGFGGSRYHVLFAGEQLPDGRKADAVHIHLHPLYQELLQQARTRPLDYEYLQQLPPSCQRFYELISFRIFAAFANGNERVKYRYSELCKFAPLTRYTAREQARKQLFKLHRPHLASGYLAAVEMENSNDADGQPDWVLWYTPGPKAQAEFRQFNTKAGRAELNAQPLRPHTAPVIKQLPPAPPAALDPTQESLAARLIAAGVAKAVARKLVSKDAAECARQLAALRQRENVKNQGAYLAQAIRERYPLPAAPAKAAQQEEQTRARAASQQQEKEKQAADERRIACELAAERRYPHLSPEELQQRQAHAQASFKDAVLAEDFKRQGLWNSVLKSIVITQLAEELAAASTAR